MNGQRSVQPHVWNEHPPISSVKHSKGVCIHMHTPSVSVQNPQRATDEKRVQGVCGEGGEGGEAERG